MRDVVLSGVFVIALFTTLFCLLPLGLGAGVDANGAPSNPRILLKLGIATAAAIMLTAIFYGLITMGVLDI